jgi:hypothetical protein
MVALRKPMDDEDLVQYILAGLDDDHDSVVNSVLARPQGITMSELPAQILSFETRIDLRSNGSGSSANFDKRGRGGFGRGRGGRGGHFPAHDHADQSMNSRGGHRSSNSDRSQC